MSKGQKKKKIVWQQYIGTAFMMLIGGICGVVMVSYLDRPTADTPFYQEILFLFGLFLGMYFALFFGYTESPLSLEAFYQCFQKEDGRKAEARSQPSV